MKRKQRRRIEASAPKEMRFLGDVHDLELAAAAEGENGKKLRKFSMTAYTGAAMRLGGFMWPVVVDLSGINVPNKRMPVLRDHDVSRIVAHTEDIEVSQQRLKVTGLISGVGDDAQEVLALADNGFPWQASIGANADRMEFIERGNSVKVNGKTHQGPLYVARATTLAEISFVPLGADNKSSADVAATAAAQTKEKPSMFEQWLESKGFDAAALNDVQKTTLKATWEAETKPAPAPQEKPASSKSDVSLDDILAAARRENERRNRIAELVADAIQNDPRSVDALEALGRQAIEGKWDTQKFELELLRARRPNAPLAYSPRQTEITQDVIEAAVCQTGGLENLDKHYKPETLEAARRRFRNGIGLQEMIMLFARRSGFNGSTFRSGPTEALQAAFRRDDRDILAQGPSTYSLPGIFENVANKFLRAGFDFVETTWRNIAAIRSVSDFKEISTYSLTGDFEYEQLPPGGEIKHGSVGEESYSNKADTYARMFGIDRRDLINDDLGALTAVARRLGRGGALKLNRVFWTEFMDNSSFFTVARNNYDAGADSALDSDGLESANLLFLNQTDPDGKTLSVMPRILLVPNALKLTAWRLINSQIVPNTTNDANPWAGMFQVVSSSYLSDTSITGYSTTAWYLLADPNDLPVIEVVFLNGVQAPTVETADFDFDRLGVSLRGYHDFGVAKQEYRGGVKMAGV